MDEQLRELERAVARGDVGAPEALAAARERLRQRRGPPWRDMTVAEMQMALNLGECRFAPGSFDKRFGRGLAAEVRSGRAEITAKQAALLRKKVHSYRRQIPADVVALAGARLPLGGRMPEGACCTCWEPRDAHAAWCAAAAARREREALGMFADSQEAP